MDPKLVVGMPEWWDAHGAKLIPSIDKYRVLIGSNAASVTIEKDAEPGFWRVSWEVVFAAPDSKVRGCIFMDTDDVQNAFGIAEHPAKDPADILERFGCEIAERGKFIRWKNFLNIPGPGTGSGYDANVSIFITYEVKDIVAYFVSSNDKPA